MPIELIKRNYPGSDAFLLEKADTFALALDADLPDFTAFDSTMNPAWLLNVKSAITSALTYDSDELVLAQQKQKTDLVAAAMQQGMVVYNDIMYFAEQKAFKGNAAVLQEFGRGDKYRKATKNQSLMTDFLEELFRTATKYNAQLTAAGCPPAAIAAIDAACQTLRNVNADQNLTIDGRPVISQERIVQLNGVYDSVRQICEAAQRVYRTNPAKQNFYTYNPVSNGTEGGNVPFSVNPGTTVQIATVPYDPARQFIIRNTGTVIITLGLSTDGVSMGTLPVSVSPGGTIAAMSSALAPAGDFVLLQNTGADVAVGSVEWEE